MRSQLATLCWWFAIVGDAFAACDVSISNLTVNPFANYDPFVPAAATTVLQATLASAEPGPCSLTVAVSPGNPNFNLVAPGGAQLQARFLTPGTVGAHGFEQTLSVPSGPSVVSFNIEAPAGQVVPPGAYDVLLTAALVDQNGAYDQRTAQLTANVQSRAEVGVANGGGAWNVTQSGLIDLGTLTTGEAGQAFVQVRANTLTNISISSQTSSTLIRDNATPADAPIPFTVTLDAAPVNIAAGPAQIQRTPSATLVGSVYTLQVQIGTVGQHYAGQYSGTIEIDVMPVQ